MKERPTKPNVEENNIIKGMRKTMLREKDQPTKVAHRALHLSYPDANGRAREEFFVLSEATVVILGWRQGGDVEVLCDLSVRNNKLGF